MIRGLLARVLAVAVNQRCGFRPLRLGIAVKQKREFRPSRLRAVLVTMISLASGVWTLLSDDLSSVIFWTVYRTPSKVFDIPRLTGTNFEIL